MPEEHHLYSALQAQTSPGIQTYRCCKRRIHERDSNPAPLSFRDSALPIRLPGITHTHGSFLLHCSPAPTGCVLTPYLARGGTMGRGFEPLPGANVAKEGSTSGIRTQHPCLSGTVPYRLGYRGSHTLMGPSCYTATACWGGGAV